MNKKILIRLLTDLVNQTQLEVAKHLNHEKTQEQVIDEELRLVDKCVEEIVKLTQHNEQH